MNSTDENIQQLVRTSITGNIDPKDPIDQLSSKSVCVLVAEVSGHEALVQKIGDYESNRALRQLLQRAQRCIESNHGLITTQTQDKLVAIFESSDYALIAARDIRKRTRRLPPVSGIVLALRTGLHSGVVDIVGSVPSGPAVRTVEQLAKAAEPGHILLTSDTMRKLSNYTRNMVDESKPKNLTGLDAPAYAMASEEAMTIMQYDAAAKPKVTRLTLSHRGASYSTSESHPILLLGRDEDNDINVVDRRTSRHHARIEYRQGQYFLIDSSTNGTFLLSSGDEEVRLRKNEAPLPAKGKIGCGFSPNKAEPESISFQIVE